MGGESQEGKGYSAEMVGDGEEIDENEGEDEIEDSDTTCRSGYGLQQSKCIEHNDT